MSTPQSKVLAAVCIYNKHMDGAMVIGRAGQNLKKVGQYAREEIAVLLGRKVHLELWVKVRADWPEDLNFLHSLGLGAAHQSDIDL